MVDTIRNGGSAGALALVVGLGLAGGFGGAGAQVGPLDLSNHLEPGLELRYEMINTTRTTIPGMGEVAQSQRQITLLEVVAVDPVGNSRIRSTVESIRFEMDSPVGMQRYDSERDPEPTEPELRAMAALVGVTLESVVGPDGSLREMVGLEEYRKQMLAEVPPEAREMMESFLSPEAMENMMAAFFQELPHGAVEIGDQWESSLSVPLPFGTMTYHYHYTYRSLETREGREVAVLDVEGTVGALEPDPENPMAAMISSTGGDISGTIELDAANGLILDSNMETVMTMEVAGNAIESNSVVELHLLR